MVVAGGIEMLGAILPVAVLVAFAWLGFRRWRGRRATASVLSA
jgi:uncharacterized protein (TIGR03382 family)